MSWPQTQITLLETAITVTGFLANWLLQTTILISAGIGIGRLLQGRGAAVQSIVYRTTLATVAACPLVTGLFSLTGVSGWSWTMPSGWSSPAIPVAAESPPLTTVDQPLLGRAAEINEANLPAPSTTLVSDFAQTNVEPQPPTTIDVGLHRSAAIASPTVVRDHTADTDSAQRAPAVSLFGVVAVGVAGLWAVASIILLLRLAMAWKRVAALRRRAIPAEPEVLALCRELAATFDVDPPDVLRSPYVPSPFLTGVFRPAVLLPEAGLELPLREVLIHELAHLQRRDCVWNLCRQVLLSVHGIQPLLWRLSRRMDETAEEVCDDYVMHFGGDRENYARRLVDLAELATVPVAAVGVGMVLLRSVLARRVMRILDSSRSLSTGVGRRVLWSVLAGGLACTLCMGLIGLEARSSLAKAESALAAQPGVTAETATPAEQEPVSVYAGQVVDPNGQPVAGAKIYLVYYVPDLTGLLVPNWKSRATTDATGRFQFSMRDEDFGENASSREWKAAAICAVADGHGFAWSMAALFEPDGKTVEKWRALLPTTSVQHREYLQRHLDEFGKPLRLTADDQPLRGQIVDINGAPVAGAKLTLRHVDTGYDERLDQWLAATRLEQADFYSAREKTPKSINGPQVRSLVVPAVTDRDGKFVLRGIGNNRLVELLIEGPGIQSDKLVARTQPGDKVELLQQWSAPELGKFVVHPHQFVHIAGPSKPVIGMVKDQETGAPLPGVFVVSQKRHGHPISGWGQDFVRTVSGPDGRFRLEGLPIGSDNQIAAIAPTNSPYFSMRQAARTDAAGAVVEVNFALLPGLWINGRVTDKATGKGLSGTVTYFAFNDNPQLKSVGRLGYVDERERLRVREDGRFRIAGLAGRGIVAFQADEHEQYPRAIGADQIDGAKPFGGGMPVFSTQPTTCVAANYHILAGVNPQRDGPEIALEWQLDSGITVEGKVVDSDGKSLATALYSGRLKEFTAWRTVKPDGTFSIHGYDPATPRQLVFYDRDRGLAGQLILSGPVLDPFEVRLVPAGTVKGRLIDENGDLLSGISISRWTPTLSSPVAMVPKGMPRSVPLPPNSGTQEQHATDDQGRFEITGLVPEEDYRLRALDRFAKPRERTRRSGPIDAVIRVKPGEVLDLGDVRITDEAKFNAANALKAAAVPSAKISGRVTGADGRAVAGVQVAAVALRMRPMRGGDLSSNGEVLASAVTDQDGRFVMNRAASSSTTHAYGHLIARADGRALAWQPLDLDAAEVEATLELPAEEPIRGRLVDIEGRPASHIRLSLIAVVDSRHRDRPSVNAGFDMGQNIPAAWPSPVVSDDQGRFTLRSIPAGHGVYLTVEGTDRFAPQHIALNTGMPEQRGSRDGTYRPLVKNGEDGAETTLTLAPAQPFEGVVRYADTGEPAPHARLTIWASQQEYGSMMSVAGQADAQGRYRLQPYPGIRFGITAYPPTGTPYLARQTSLSKAIRWEAGDKVKQIDIALPRGVLVKGRVVEKTSHAAVVNASVQYHPESANNKHTADDILTGWNDIQLTDANGEFQIAVLSGPGRLLAHGPQGEFVLQETSGRELSRGSPGGQRHYANAIHKIDPQVGQEALEVALEIQRGATVSGRIVDEQQQLVEPVLVISRLNISPAILTWRGDRHETRGGRFQLAGLDPDREYPVLFLDPKRQLAAKVMIRAQSESPTVVLKPCGKATARFVDENGQPLVGAHANLHFILTPGAPRFDLVAMKAGLLSADADFVANIDRTNYWDGPKADEQGRITMPALIPGATYQLQYVGPKGKSLIKEFTVESQQTLDLGDIVCQEEK